MLIILEHEDFDMKYPIVIRFFFIGLPVLAVQPLGAMQQECAALKSIYEDLTIITRVREKYGEYVKALNALLKISREIDDALINSTLDPNAATLAQNAIIGDLKEIVQEREDDERSLYRELNRIAKKVEILLCDPAVSEEIKQHVVAQKEATLQLLFKS